MQGSIIQTIVSKASIAIGNFLILLLTTQFLGAGVRGEIALLVIAISITALISQVIGGPAIIYLSRENNTNKMFLPAYLWAVLASFLVNYILCEFSLLPDYLFLDAFLISLLHCFALINSFFLLGKQNFKTYNYLMILQTIVTLVVLYGLISFDVLDVSAYKSALVIAYFLVFLISFLIISKELRFREFELNLKLAYTMLTYGFITQTANLSHLLSNRISYFVVEILLGLSLLGIFSAGSSFAETSLIVSASASMIMYSRISAEGKTTQNILQTLVWSRISFWLTFSALIVLCLLPESLYLWLLGNEFGRAKEVIFALTPGLSLLSASALLSHYFSGTGRFKISTYSSLISFAVTATLIYPFVSFWELKGAAWATSAGFTASTFFLFYMFKRELRFNIKSLLLNKSDFQLILNEISQSISIKRNK
jgi:O-antigen/teichoic acid export membrane protein